MDFIISVVVYLLIEHVHFTKICQIHSCQYILASAVFVKLAGNPISIPHRILDIVLNFYINVGIQKCVI